MHVLRLGKKQYFVKWIGYDSSQNTWEPEKNLSTVKDLVQKYNKGSFVKKQKQVSSKNKPAIEQEIQDVSLGSFAEQQGK